MSEKISLDSSDANYKFCQQYPYCKDIVSR